MELNQQHIALLIDGALAEDIGKGDITSLATINQNEVGEFNLIAKQDMVLCGLDFFCGVFKKIDSDINLEILRKEGSKIKKGEVFIKGKGNLQAILAGERVALNFLQYLSGIATLTHKFVLQLQNYPTQILDTRKTLPLYRDAAKYAVTVGGGKNHRMRLDDGILIKDNHIKASGSITQAVAAVRDQYPTMSIEVECETINEVEQACKAKVDIIMLDNMDLGRIKNALEIISRDKIKVEVSGNINLDNIREIAALGVDYISVGALTHSVMACDISLNINIKNI